MTLFEATTQLSRKSLAEISSTPGHETSFESVSTKVRLSGKVDRRSPGRPRPEIENSRCLAVAVSSCSVPGHSTHGHQDGGHLDGFGRKTCESGVTMNTSTFTGEAICFDSTRAKEEYQGDVDQPPRGPAAEREKERVRGSGSYKRPVCTCRPRPQVCVVADEPPNNGPTVRG